MKLNKLIFTTCLLSLTLSAFGKRQYIEYENSVPFGLKKTSGYYSICNPYIRIGSKLLECTSKSGLISLSYTGPIYLKISGLNGTGSLTGTLITELEGKITSDDRIYKLMELTAGEIVEDYRSFPAITKITSYNGYSASVFTHEKRDVTCAVAFRQLPKSYETGSYTEKTDGTRIYHEKNSPGTWKICSKFYHDDAWRCGYVNNDYIENTEGSYNTILQQMQISCGAVISYNNSKISKDGTLKMLKSLPDTFSHVNLYFSTESGIYQGSSLAGRKESINVYTIWNYTPLLTLFYGSIPSRGATTKELIEKYSISSYELADALTDSSQFDDTSFFLMIDSSLSGYFIESFTNIVADFGYSLNGCGYASCSGSQLAPGSIDRSFDYMLTYHGNHRYDRYFSTANAFDAMKFSQEFADEIKLSYSYHKMFSMIKDQYTDYYLENHKESDDTRWDTYLDPQFFVFPGDPSFNKNRIFTNSPW